MSNELTFVQDNGIVAKAEIDMMVSTAKAYPRDVTQALEMATQLVTFDEETAQSCFYALPRKDKEGNRIEIKGPSIRLAEILSNCWGNLHTAARVVEVAEKHITVEAVAWDLQTNRRATVPERVSIWFGEKNGKGGYRANNDMQIMLTKAACAKAIRNAIFQVVPKVYANKLYQVAMNYAVGDVKTLSTKVSKVVEKLVKMGIQKEDLLSYFGHTNFGDFTHDDLTSLIGIGTALKEGMIKPEEVFSHQKVGNESASEKLNQLLDEKRKVNPETGEIS